MLEQRMQGSFKRRLLIAVFLGVSAAASFAQTSAKSYLSFLSAADLGKLEANGSLTGFGVKLQDLGIWKVTPFADLVRSAVGGIDSSIATESLFLVDRPAVSSKGELDAKVFRAFTAFEAMKGLLVYSESKKRMETFILDSHRVDSVSSLAALPDPVEASAPSHAEYSIYQKEEQFKDVYSRFTFDLANGLYEVSLVNLTPMRYLLITFVPPELLHTTFVVVPLSDKLLVYGVTVAGTPRLFGLERSKQSSFSNRLKALISWFSANLAAN